MPESQLIEINVDLRKYPEVTNENQSFNHLAFGDLHGNTIKLIHLLIMHGVLELGKGKDDYDKLIELYDKAGKYKNNAFPKGPSTHFKVGSNLTRSDIEQFSLIVKRMKFNNKHSISFIGDELADRGFNDYFTLMIFNEMKLKGVDYEVMLSNHGAVFLKWCQSFLNNSPYTDDDLKMLQSNQQDSLIRLNNILFLLDNNEQKYLKKIIKEVYLPSLKIVSCVYDYDEQLIINFTHAPTNYKILERIAIDLELLNAEGDLRKLKPEEILNLYISINRMMHSLDINSFISLLIDSVDEYLKSINKNVRAVPDKNKNELEFPFGALLWNRNYLGYNKHDLDLEKIESKWVCGHVGNKDSQQLQIIDDDLGKDWLTEADFENEALKIYSHKEIEDNVRRYEINISKSFLTSGLPLLKVYKIIQDLDKNISRLSNVSDLNEKKLITLSVINQFINIINLYKKYKLNNEYRVLFNSLVSSFDFVTIDLILDNLNKSSNESNVLYEIIIDIYLDNVLKEMNSEISLNKEIILHPNLMKHYINKSELEDDKKTYINKIADLLKHFLALDYFLQNKGFKYLIDEHVSKLDTKDKIYILRAVTENIQNYNFGNIIDYLFDSLKKSIIDDKVELGKYIIELINKTVIGKDDLCKQITSNFLCKIILNNYDKDVSDLFTNKTIELFIASDEKEKYKNYLSINLENDKHSLIDEVQVLLNQYLNLSEENNRNLQESCFSFRGEYINPDVLKEIKSILELIKSENSTDVRKAFKKIAEIDCNCGNTGDLQKRVAFLSARYIENYNMPAINRKFSNK